MYPFSLQQNVTPAARSHMEAQVSFINDMSKSLFRSFQQFCDLNIQLAQTLLEETTRTSQELLTTQRQSEVIGAATSRAQPAAEKMRAYQQHLTRIAADTQVELARVAEDHVQETSRTARALADEVARTANEETERSRNNQQEAIREFRDPFADGMQHRDTRGNEMRSGASMQSGGQEGHSGASMQGGVQTGAGSVQGSASVGTKQGTATRKET